MPTCDEITKAVGKYNNENSTDDLALRSALGTIQGRATVFGALPSGGLLDCRLGINSVNELPLPRSRCDGRGDQNLVAGASTDAKLTR